MEMQWKDKYKRVYQSSSILDTKIDIHSAYSSMPTDIFGTIGRTIRAPNHLSILDIGCGTGGFLLYLASLGHRGCLSGIDLTENISKQAKAKKDIQFSVGDIEALPFIDASFDVITAIHMLSHVQNLGNAIGEVQRVLTRGGQFIATANSLQSYPHVAEYRRRIFQRFGWGEPMFSTIHFNLKNMTEVLGGYWKRIDLITLIGELQIPVQPFLRYFVANIDVWEKVPTVKQRDEIFQIVSEWSVQDEVGGCIIEPKKVGIATCSNH